MRDRYQELKDHLHSWGRLLVAFSGGVDSAFLAKAALDALGKENILAATAVSPSLPQREKQAALSLAEDMGLPHCFVFSDEWKSPAYLENTPQRCFYCKEKLYTHLRVLAKKKGFLYIANGANLDDKSDFRPGQKAASQEKILSPLQELEFTKEEIRTLAKEKGVSAWDKPASPCLSSRIPYYQRISVEKLEQIERAEDFLHSQGIKNFRVRHHGELARIEIAKQEMNLLWDTDLRNKINNHLQALGFQYVSLDLQPLQSGRMNKALKKITPKSRN